jgi:hypothetical protein
MQTASLMIIILTSIFCEFFKATVQRDGSDPKLGSFDRSSLKCAARRFFEKSARPPSCESPLKLQRHLVQMLAIWKQIANGAHSSVSGIILTLYSYWQQRYEHIWNLLPIVQ